MALIRNCEDILSRDDFEYAIIHVPEWDGDIRIRSLTGKERSEIARMTQVRKDGDGLFETLLIMAAVDDAGKPIFRKDHLDALKTKSAAISQRIGTEVLKISGLTSDALPDIESAEKN